MLCNVVLTESFPVDEARRNLREEHDNFYGRGLNSTRVFSPEFAHLAGHLLDGDPGSWYVLAGYHSRQDGRGAAFPVQGFGWMRSSGTFIWINETFPEPVLVLSGRRHAIQAALEIALGDEYREIIENSCQRVIWHESQREDVQPWLTVAELE